MPAGGWWEKWDEVCDQVFGTKNEVIEKIRPKLFLKHLSTQETTGFSRVLAKYLFTREIEDRAIHLFPFGHELAVSSSVPRPGTVLEPQLNRRPGQSPCNIGRTSQVPGKCRWLQRGVDLGEKRKLAAGKN